MMSAIILRSCERKHLFSKGGKKKKSFLHENRGKRFDFVSSVSRGSGKTFLRDA